MYQRSGLRTRSFPAQIAVAVVSVPVGLSAGAIISAGVVVAGAGLLVAVPVVLISRAPVRYYKEKSRERRQRELIRHYENQRCIQNGVGITFVGASQEMIDYATDQNGCMHPRAISVHGDSEFSRSLHNEDKTYILYMDFMYNVKFTSTELMYRMTNEDAVLPIFPGDVPAQFRNYNIPYDVERQKSRSKPHFVILLHNVLGTGSVGHEQYRWGGARCVDGDAPTEEVQVLDFRFELEEIVPNLDSFVGEFGELDILRILESEDVLKICDRIIQWKMDVDRERVVRPAIMDILRPAGERFRTRNRNGGRIFSLDRISNIPEAYENRPPPPPLLPPPTKLAAVHAELLQFMQMK